MKIARVAFVNTVQCGGSINGATAGQVVGDRPGQTPFIIDFLEMSGIPCIRVQKFAAGKHFDAYVPIFNVSHFTPMTAEQLAASDEKDKATAAVARKAKDDADALARPKVEQKK